MPRDLDLRKVRYFVALAEELHYGRAAQRLHIAQPVLSRQIRALEAELGAVLFVRDRRGATLTPAGRTLLDDAPALLAAADAARRRVAREARGAGTFTIGFMPGLIVTAVAAAMEECRPGLRVEVVRTGWDDQVEVLRDGRADVSYVRLPVDGRDLRLVDVAEEPRVVVLAATHRLACKDVVALADLAGEHLLQNPDAVPEWRRVATEMRSTVPRVAEEVRYSVEEKLEHVARGRGIAVLPESVARFYQRPDVTVATIVDIGPSRVALAWESARRSPLIRDFTALATRGPSVVARP
ncbi:LysR family transcriptional regulator [Pseudonocardia sp.]|uniref:LysR family transcriptional regulator n=1 Tax=Pseudonocardia sp. TaxID=60912 RepID=UPI003D10033A